MADRRAMQIGKAYPRCKNAAGKPLCAVCGKPTNGRKYCSKACSDRAYIECAPSYARAMVERRDKGVCAVCRCDTEKVRRIVRAAMGWEYSLSGHRPTWSFVTSVQHLLGFNTDHFWEVDHIQAVCEGGGLCGLDNLRTLCTPCHRAETRALARRRAADRQDGKRPLLTEIQDG